MRKFTDSQIRSFVNSYIRPKRAMRRHFNPPNKIKPLYVISLLVLLSLACGTSDITRYAPASLNLSDSEGEATETPTATPTTPAIEVNVVYVGEAAGSTGDSLPTATPVPLFPQITTTPLIIATDTPTIQTATPTPISLQPTPTSVAMSGTVLTATQTSVPPTPIPPTPLAPDGSITLVELPNQQQLPVDVGPVDFKWVWNKTPACEALPDDQGFEVRVWAPGFGPLGVADVTKQDEIVCDPKSGTRTLTVGNIRNTPGVKQTGSGEFVWQVALVELKEPFTPLAVSEMRVFYLLADPATPIPTPTPVARVTPDCACEPVGGQIELIDPQHEASVPPADETMVVKWRWTGATGCDAPPPGYGFEVRIWPEDPTYSPMGAMGDAALAQGAIGCDPANGIRSYTVLDYKNTPGIKQTGSGRFKWDVIIFHTDPYEEALVSNTAIFNLPELIK